MIILYSFILGLLLLTLVYYYQDLNFKINFNLLKSVLTVVMHRIKRSLISSRITKNKVLKKLDKKDSDNIKMFQFVRIRCATKDFKTEPNENNIRNSLTEEQHLNNIMIDQEEEEEETNYKFGVPSKRSGHRAVCNEDNLYIWGGYCPNNEREHLNDEDTEEEDDDESELSPLYPEVKLLLIFDLTFNG